MVSDFIAPYLPMPVNDLAVQRWNALPALYEEWNAQINVISRKDLEFLTERHILHSLSLLPYLGPLTGQRVVDIGTGGGFPGIPLAIAYPETEWVLVDSVGKKIKVVQAIAEELELKNVTALHSRVENAGGGFQTAVTRAVAPFPVLMAWMRSQWRAAPGKRLLALKGGDLKEELKGLKGIQVHPLAHAIPLPFYETKAVVELRIFK